MSKLLIFYLVAILAVANARGLSGDVNEVKNNEIAPLQKEGRFLLEVPVIGSIVLKSLKVIWFLLSTVFSVVDFKLAALALATNFALWGLSFIKLPIIVGAVIILGLCKVTGLCMSVFDKVTGHLVYALEYLDMGIQHYGVSL